MLTQKVNSDEMSNPVAKGQENLDQRANNGGYPPEDANPCTGVLWEKVRGVS